MKKRNFPIWTILYKNLIWIIIVTILFGTFSYIYSKKKKNPTYTASAQVLVLADIDGDSKETTSTANNNASLANWVLQKVIDSFKSEEAIKTINARITDANNKIYGGSIGALINDTLIFKMSYTDVNPNSAKIKLGYAIEGFSWWFEEYDKMGVDIISTGTVGLKLLQQESDVVTNIPYLKDCLYGIGFGLLLSCVLAVLIYIFDNKVREEKELEQITGVRLISYITNKNF